MVFDFLKDLFATKPHTYGSKIKNVPPIEDYIGLGVLIDVRGSSNENNNLEIKDKIKEFLLERMDSEFVDKVCEVEKITYSWLRGLERAIDALYLEHRFPLGNISKIIFKAIDEIKSLKNPEDGEYLIDEITFAVNISRGELFSSQDGICETYYNETYNKYFEYEIMYGDIERVKEYRDFMPINDRARMFIMKTIFDKFEDLKIDSVYKRGFVHALAKNIWDKYLVEHKKFISYEYFLFINFNDWALENIHKELKKLENIKEYKDGFIEGNELEYDIYDMRF